MTTGILTPSFTVLTPELDAFTSNYDWEFERNQMENMDWIGLDLIDESSIYHNRDRWLQEEVN